LQENNAIQVVSNNERLLGEAYIGDIVVFFSSEFDCGIDSHMSYQLACSVGILDKYMARNAFQIVQDTVDFQITREKMISPREAVRLLSIGNGQCFIMFFYKPRLLIYEIFVKQLKQLKVQIYIDSNLG
jgi:hypothetical protein